ncbi:MAG: arginase family protein, partial [Anaerolineales bacterium]|nr:arginase family protein [Anaerolineales bacterium]
MNNRFILTPYFLDQPMPGLEGVVDSELEVNQLHISEANAQNRMGVLYQPLADFVNKAISRGERPVSIAGDCCTSIGVIAGLQRAGTDPTLIWFDAHGDFNTWKTTPSGFLGGMPLAMLVGRGEQTILEAVNLEPIPESQIILTDA